MQSDLIFSSTTLLAAAIQARRVSAVDVLEAHLAQIERHNPALNAVVTFDADAARQRAREADQALAQGVVWGPLHGVPFTLKDAHSTAGMRTTVGFPPLADHVPQRDGTVAARLKAAGGILMGKTNVAMMLGDPAQTANPIFGRTNNPWNAAYTPGGSSGGAAAAVAAGMTPFEIGTDLAGSVRIPAHFCGLFGLKPTEHRVSLDGVVPDPWGTPRSVRLLSSVGPLARSADDLALLYMIIAGPDGRDTEVPPVPLENLPGLEWQSLRVAFAPTFPGYPAAAEIREAVREVALNLASLGAAVEEAALPDLDFAQEPQKLGQLIEMMLGAFQPEGAFQQKGQEISLAQYLTALHQRDASIQAWEQFFESWDFLLCPVSMTGAFTHRESGSPLVVDGQEVSYWMANAHCVLFNYSGHPAVTLPYQLDQNGLPIGIQVVARRWDEARLLAFACLLAQVTGQFQAPPGFVLPAAPQAPALEG